MQAVTLQVFSDYSCPFCYLGAVNVQQAARQTGATVVWRAHQLRVAGAPRLDPQSPAMVQGWREQVFPLAERCGVTIRQPSRVPLTRLAHEAAAWARAQGRFEAFHAAIFRAYFLEDADIGATETLLALAQQQGMDANDLAAALKEQRFAEEVEEDLLIGQTYGVTGVPTCVLGGTLLYGVQEVATLVRAIEAVRAGRPVLEVKKLPTVPVNLTRK